MSAGRSDCSSSSRSAAAASGAAPSPEGGTGRSAGHHHRHPDGAEDAQQQAEGGRRLRWHPIDVVDHHREGEVRRRVCEDLTEHGQQRQLPVVAGGLQSDPADGADPDRAATVVELGEHRVHAVGQSGGTGWARTVVTAQP